MPPAPLHIVLIGPPGAGKSTVGQSLSALIDITVISTGVILRDEIKTGSALGQEIARRIDAGDFVTDDMIGRVLIAQCSHIASQRGILLDGYPRNLAQAAALPQMLATFGRRIDAVILLELPDDQVFERLGGRRMCVTPDATYPVHMSDVTAMARCAAQHGVLTVRPDDAPDIIAHRLRVYHSTTAPLIAHYEAQGVLRRVDARAEAGAIARTILSMLNQTVTPV